MFFFLKFKNLNEEAVIEWRFFVSVTKMER